MYVYVHLCICVSSIVWVGAQFWAKSCLVHLWTHLNPRFGCTLIHADSGLSPSLIAHGSWGPGHLNEAYRVHFQVSIPFLHECWNISYEDIRNRQPRWMARITVFLARSSTCHLKWHGQLLKSCSLLNGTQGGEEGGRDRAEGWRRTIATDELLTVFFFFTMFTLLWLKVLQPTSPVSPLWWVCYQFTESVS